MLSRTAEGLFWMGRHIERADNVARLMEAGRRLDGVAAAGDAPDHAGGVSEWGAILIASGCGETFPHDLKTARGAAAVRHMIAEETANPSSLRACFASARANARAQRVALTTEVWTAVNDAWRETRALDPGAPEGLAALLERARARTALVWGAVDGTLMRNESYDFIRLGQFIERADATARLLDVKHAALGGDSAEDLRPNRDVEAVQWSHLLRAAGAFVAYRWVYRGAVRRDRVADFLILHPESPRSLRFCYEEIRARIESLRARTGAAHASAAAAEARRDAMSRDDVKRILCAGLHDYLTDVIVDTNRLAIMIADDFGFGAEASQAPQSQTQVQMQTQSG